jgi:hypothetical protein
VNQLDSVLRILLGCIKTLLWLLKMFNVFILVETWVSRRGLVIKIGIWDNVGIFKRELDQFQKVRFKLFAFTFYEKYDFYFHTR